MPYDAPHNRAQADKARADALVAKSLEDRDRLIRIAGHYDAMADIQDVDPVLR